MPWTMIVISLSIIGFVCSLLKDIDNKKKEKPSKKVWRLGLVILILPNIITFVSIDIPKPEIYQSEGVNEVYIKEEWPFSVYYTTKPKSDPEVTGVIYENPIQITESTSISAKATLFKLIWSQVVSEDFPVDENGEIWEDLQADEPGSSISKITSVNLVGGPFSAGQKLEKNNIIVEGQTIAGDRILIQDFSFQPDKLAEGDNIIQVSYGNLEYSLVESIAYDTKNVNIDSIEIDSQYNPDNNRTCFMINFSMESACDEVKLSILGEEDKVIEAYTITDITGKKKNSYEWIPADDIEEGTYHVAITAGTCSKKEKIIYKYPEFAGGNGTKQDPYLIMTAEHFQNIYKYPTGYFKQVSSIDFQYESLMPMFSTDQPFSGMYDGDGYAISNFIINTDTDYVGVFSAIARSGIVKNLTVKNCNIHGKYYVGIISGQNDGKIEDCILSESTVSGVIMVGGIVGKNDGSVIMCEVTDNNISSDGFDSTGSGGVCGENHGIITDSKTSKNEITSKNFPGGVVAINFGTVKNCSGEYNILNRTNKREGVLGEIVGKNDNGGKVDNCSKIGEGQVIGY